jgi:hypothetical protein
MPIPLIGHWSESTLTESHHVGDGDQEAIDAVLAGPDRDRLWAWEYLIDKHSEAVQMAYEEQIDPDAGEDLLDEAEGYEPTR